MLLNLSDLSPEPLQSQIVRQMRAGILAGDIQAETNLPSIRALASDQHVSVITVQRAYEHLEREGLIHSRRGKGFFVSALRTNEKKSMAKQRLIEKIDSQIAAALSEGLSAEEVKAIVESLVKKNGTRQGADR